MKLIHQGNHTLKLRRQTVLDFPLHLQHALEIVLVTEGRAEVLYENRRFSLEKGDLFLIFPDRIHGFEKSRDLECFVMIVPIEPYLGTFRGELEKKIPLTPLLKEEEWKKTELLSLMKMASSDWDEAQESQRRGYAAVAVGKILAVTSLKNAPSKDTDAVSTVLHYVNGHYREMLSRKRIAREVGYHESYISHIFLENLGTSLSDYLASLRINDALDLLKGTDQSISSIALSLGFGSIRSFNRTFLRLVHTTPRKYRDEK